MTDLPFPTNLIFRHGADMTPEAILSAHPGARFLARARRADQPDQPEHPATWGILIALPAHTDPPPGSPVPIITDDGRATEAIITTAAVDTADPDAVRAAARYWELPG